MDYFFQYKDKQLNCSNDVILLQGEDNATNFVVEIQDEEFSGGSVFLDALLPKRVALRTGLDKVGTNKYQCAVPKSWTINHGQLQLQLVRISQDGGKVAKSQVLDECIVVSQSINATQQSVDIPNTVLDNIYLELAKRVTNSEVQAELVVKVDKSTYDTNIDALSGQIENIESDILTKARKKVLLYKSDSPDSTLNWGMPKGLVGGTEYNINLSSYCLLEIHVSMSNKVADAVFQSSVIDNYVRRNGGLCIIMEGIQYMCSCKCTESSVHFNFVERYANSSASFDNNTYYIVGKIYGFIE